MTRAVLGNERWPVTRQVAELWRAALSDRDSRLADELSSSWMGEACSIASSDLGPGDAVREFEGRLAEQREAGLNLDLAKRALARSRAEDSGAHGFAAELFAEMTSYYASRDLPSVVGREGRVGSASESIELKRQMRDLVRTEAREAGPVPTTTEGWSNYIGRVLDNLENIDRSSDDG